MMSWSRASSWSDAVMIGLLSAFSAQMVHAQEQAAIDRTVLPIQVPALPPFTELDVRDATMPVPFAVTAPEGAPNVVPVRRGADSVAF